MDSMTALILAKLGISEAFSKISIYLISPVPSITNADLFETPNRPKLNSSYKHPYAFEAALLKSDNRRKFNWCSSLYLANVKGESTEIKETGSY